MHDGIAKGMDLVCGLKLGQGIKKITYLIEKVKSINPFTEARKKQTIF